MSRKKFLAVSAALIATGTIYGAYAHDWQWVVAGALLFSASLIPLAYDKLAVKVVLKNDGSEVSVDASRIEN